MHRSEPKLLNASLLMKAAPMIWLRLQAFIYLNLGSPNFLVRGPQKLLLTSSKAVHLTQCDCFGNCCILPNQKIFVVTIFFLAGKTMASRTVVWRTWSNSLDYIHNAIFFACDVFVYKHFPTFSASTTTKLN